MQVQNLVAVAIGITILAIVVFQVAVPQIKNSYSQEIYLYSVEGEIFNAPTYDTPVSLANDNIKEYSEKVYNSTYTAVRGTDYTMDYSTGTITALSTGNLLNNTNYYIDYDYYSSLQGSEGSLAALAPLFIVIGIFVVVAGAFVLRWL